MKMFTAFIYSLSKEIKREACVKIKSTLKVQYSMGKKVIRTPFPADNSRGQSYIFVLFIKAKMSGSIIFTGFWFCTFS